MHLPSAYLDSDGKDHGRLRFARLVLLAKEMNVDLVLLGATSQHLHDKKSGKMEEIRVLQINYRTLLHFFLQANSVRWMKDCWLEL